MIFTLEARWFDSSPAPTELRNWFDTLGSTEAVQWSDLYLLSQDPALNLKLREGNVQVKHRLGSPLPRSLGPQVSAQCEQWVKWSFSCTDDTSLPWDTDPTGLWIPVQKTRRRHRFVGDTQKNLSEALPTSPPAAVEVELTEVQVEEETAWTFCLEAEGPTDGLHETLTHAASALFTNDFPVSLPADRSFGYVQWLQELSPTNGRPARDVLISAD